MWSCIVTYHAWSRNLSFDFLTHLYRSCELVWSTEIVKRLFRNLHCWRDPHCTHLWNYGSPRPVRAGLEPRREGDLSEVVRLAVLGQAEEQLVRLVEVEPGQLQAGLAHEVVPERPIVVVHLKGIKGRIGKLITWSQKLEFVSVSKTIWNWGCPWHILQVDIISKSW